MSDGAKKVRKIAVDRSLCIGAGPCVFAAGTVFELDGERKAVILQKDGKKDSGPAMAEALADGTVTDETLIAAAQSCPVRAIFLYGEDGKPIEN